MQHVSSDLQMQMCFISQEYWDFIVKKIFMFCSSLAISDSFQRLTSCCHGGDTGDSLQQCPGQEDGGGWNLGHGLPQHSRSVYRL